MVFHTFPPGLPVSRPSRPWPQSPTACAPRADGDVRRWLKGLRCRPRNVGTSGGSEPGSEPSLGNSTGDLPALGIDVNSTHMERYPAIFYGDIKDKLFQWSGSIAMFVYQRVGGVRCNLQSSQAELESEGFWSLW